MIHVTGSTGRISLPEGRFSTRLSLPGSMRLGLSRSSCMTRLIRGGLKFDQLSIPPADAQFLQSREFQVAEVARMFGIPPHITRVWQNCRFVFQFNFIHNFQHLFFNLTFVFGNFAKPENVSGNL